MDATTSAALVVPIDQIVIWEGIRSMSAYCRVCLIVLSAMGLVLSGAGPVSAARSLFIIQPNGGEWVEPNQIVEFMWGVSGTDWLPTDTVKLEYSTNNGATWSKIQGATSRPYMPGIYDWRVPSASTEAARVRVVYNDDAAVNDVSNGYFRIRRDADPPAITHAPLTYTNNLAGPYTVTAQVTDAKGLASVTLHWRKGGGSYTANPMTPTGADLYSFDIPGPSAMGDSYDYYIEAVDASVGHNVSTSPSAGSTEPHHFNIGHCGTDSTGDSDLGGGGPGISYGNVYACSVDSVLKEIEHRMDLAHPAEIRFAVYEGLSQTGPYNKIHETLSSGGSGMAWHSSGPVDVPMTSGRYYVIGCGSPEMAQHPWPISNVFTFAFGQLKGGWGTTTYPTPATTTTTQAGPYSQRLSTCRVLSLTITQPNGGEWYDPGSTIQVDWNTSEPNWTVGDTVKLEYSIDSGTTWTQIPGATAIPYDAGSYSWDTSGVAPSDHCRVRALYTADTSVNDASDGDFTIATDTVPPVITHTPLSDTGEPGPYRVSALVTDNTGVGSVTLYRSLNGSDFAAVPMAPSGNPNEYCADIEANIGDQVCYYIEAQDSSLAGNTSRSPAQGANCFAITTCAAEVLGSPTASYSPSAAAQGAFFTCNLESTLRQIEWYLDIATTATVRFLVYEAPTGQSSYALIYDEVLTLGSGTKWYSSGQMNLKLVPGRRYIIGAASYGGVKVFRNTSTYPVPVSFGQCTGGYYRASYPPPSTTSSSYSSSYIYYQRLTVCPTPRALKISQPNGGQVTEPGLPMQVSWMPGGPAWQPDETVRLEYSTDSGTIWAPIFGAEALPCSASSYTWDTTAYPESDHYRLRVVSNYDNEVSDASDADFVVRYDTTPPSITHTPIADSASLLGPYTVEATITDDRALSGVTLYWNKNGGEFTSVAMTAWGENKYRATIPGLSTFGDVYCYYIEAVDTSLAHNTSRFPAESPASPQCFTVTGCGTSTVGAFSSNDHYTDYACGNVFYCSSGEKLTQIEQYLDIGSSTDLTFFVYESSTLTGTYQKIYQSVVPGSGTGAGWYSSGPVSALLVQGRYYIIGVTCSGSATYYRLYSSSAHPATTSFGQTKSGYYKTNANPLGQTTTNTGSSYYSYYQRLSTCKAPRMLEVTQPAGGEWYQPGDAAQINLSAVGLDWQPTDTIRLDYSSDSGSTWSAIQGAESLPYDTAAFDWNTSGYPDSDQYRIRVVSNDDPTVQAASKSDFAIGQDTVGPTIVHTPLQNTSYLSARTALAEVTDNYGVASVTLYYSKNGSDFTPVTMSPVNHGYSGKIPGGARGDVYRYYIEARDTSAAGNLARYPTTDYMQYEIIDDFTEVFSSRGYLDLGNRCVMFTPDGSVDFYAACCRPILSLPTNPAGGTQLTLADDESIEVVLQDGAQVSLFGTQWSSFYVGSNGYVTFGSPDTDNYESTTDHFRLPRISGLFSNLNPSAGGVVSWKQTPDRVAVTYEKVPGVGLTYLRTFQIEMFFDGRISLSYLPMTAAYGIVGLSAGQGISTEFSSSNFSAYPACSLAQLAVDDSVMPLSDRAVPMGEVPLGGSRTARITVRNNGEYDAIVTGIRLASYIETFDDGLAQGWQETWDVDWNVVSGTYRSHAVTSSTHCPLTIYGDRTFDNFYYECRAACDQEMGTYYCPVFRATEDFQIQPDMAGSGYYFAVDTSVLKTGGRYQLLRVMNGVANYIKEGYASGLNRGEKWNTFGIDASGATLRFYINGTLVTTVIDSVLSSGRVGVIAAPYADYYQGIMVTSFYDDFLVSPPLDSVASSGVAGFTLAQTPALPVALAPGQSLEFDVTYSPQAVGDSQAFAVISTLGTTEPTIAVALSGSGVQSQTIGTIKVLPEDSAVEVFQKRVSAVFEDRFYVQDKDRTSGIGVLTSGPGAFQPVVGEQVHVSGTLKTVDGERMILPSVAGGDPTGVIEMMPLYMSNRAIGGGPYFYVPDPPERGQNGVHNGVGLNNIGLLVRVCGKITQIGPNYVYIDDGSSLDDGTFTGVEPNIGLRVLCDPTGHSKGNQLVVTGISSCFKDGDRLIRMIRARN